MASYQNVKTKKMTMMDTEQRSRASGPNRTPHNMHMGFPRAQQGAYAHPHGGPNYAPPVRVPVPPFSIHATRPTGYHYPYAYAHAHAHANAHAHAYPYQQASRVERKESALKVTDKNGKAIDVPKSHAATTIDNSQKKDVVESHESGRKLNILRITDKDGNEIDLPAPKPKTPRFPKSKHRVEIVRRKKNILRITDKNGNEIVLPKKA